MRHIFTLFLSWCVVMPSFAAGFQQEAWDARSTALGNTHVGAIDDNGISPFWNPASLGAVEKGEFSFTYGTPSELADKKDRQLGSLLYTDLNRENPFRIGFWANRFQVEDTLRETAYALTAARRLVETPEGGRFFSGVNLKYLDNHDLTLANKGSHSTLSGDIGFIYALPSKATIGLSLRDINAPRVGVNRDERVGVKSALGITYPVAASTLLLFDIVGTSNHKQKDNIETRAGLEHRVLNDKLALRAGINSSSINTGFGVRFNVGKSAVLDAGYAYVDPYSDGSKSRIHMGTLKLQFGAPTLVEEEATMSELIETAPAAAESTLPRTRSDFLVGPDDVIQIEVKNHPELDVISVVNPWGFIEVPFVGPVSVKDQNEKEIEALLSKTYSDFFTTPPVVDVIVKEYNSRFVYVLGAIAKPGKYALKSNPVTLRDVIVMAGLPTDRAALWRAFVVRKTKNGTVSKHINLQKILYRGDTTNNIELESQDIVYLPMTFLDAIATFVGRIVSPVVSIPAYILGAGSNNNSN